MFTVSKEKKLQVSRVEKKIFLNRTVWFGSQKLTEERKKSDSIFCFPLWFDRKKLRKSVARIIIHKDSALKEIAIKLYDSVVKCQANLLVDLWHYHYFIQTFVFDKNIR